MPGRPRRNESPHRDASKALAARIRARREELGWSQQRLAQSASVAYGTVRAIETNAVVEPGVFTIQLIATALGTDLTELVVGGPARQG